MIRKLLETAADIIGREARGIELTHTLPNGRWDNAYAVSDHKEMIAVMAQLRALATADIELIRWHPASEPPDDDTTVLTYMPHGTHDDDEVWPGYIEAEEWWDSTGIQIEGVTKWAHMPEGGEK